MFRERLRIRGTIQNFLPWFGLLLMIASIVWWQLISKPVTTTTPVQASAPAPFALVVLDPGHGGQDSGAMCGGVLEKDFTLDVAQRVDRLLQAQGMATLMTRVGDSYVSLADRAALANRSRDCIFVSIHFNEGNKPVSSGVETYYGEHQTAPGPPFVAWLPFLQRVASESPSLESQSLAGFIQEALVARTQALDRGAKTGPFFVISNVRHPAVLVEGGFLTNKEDIAKLANSEYRDQIAAAISEGILRYREILKQPRTPSGLAVTTPEGTE
jgi:N-acetylmuramoyl-L-alanine amidase